MSSLTKHYFSTDISLAAVTDITDTTPPVRGGGCHCVSRQQAAEVEEQTHPTKRKPVYAPRRYWPLVADMPALAHWPDRDQPFDYANSQVIAFIMARCDVSQKTAIRIFDSANQKGVIRFDQQTKRWSGVKGGAQ